MTHPAWRAALVPALITAAVPAANAETQAEGQFEKGVAAFKAGDYQQAAGHFEAARAAGLSSPALYYNLGVSYYRLEHYAKAATAFHQLADNPTNRGLAHYNLGLVALAQDNPGRAREHFLIARDEAGSDRVRRLAEQRLGEAEAGERVPRRFSALVSVSAGYNDNVVLEPDDTFVPGDRGDEFLQYLAAGTAQLAGDAGEGFQLKASVLGIDYFDLNRFDQNFLRGGAEWDQELGGWDTDLAAYVDWLNLDGELFETIVTGEAEGLRTLTESTRLRLRYRFSRIEAEAPYEHLTGSRHRMAVEGRYRGPFDARAGYELEYNDREDLSTATSFTSVSPTRHEVFAEAEYPFGGAWKAEGKVEYRHSRYHDANTDAATGLDRIREDDRLRLQATVSRKLPWQLEAFAEYEYTENDSNITDYDYTANVYRLGLERFF